ncbi:MAG TPA: OmpA family protein [Polyangiaceae bacterium]|nr:OmpA family protein [Polyangiaceae bacterium]
MRGRTFRVHTAFGELVLSPRAVSDGPPSAEEKRQLEALFSELSFEIINNNPGTLRELRDALSALSGLNAASREPLPLSTLTRELRRKLDSGELKIQRGTAPSKPAPRSNVSAPPELGPPPESAPAQLSTFKVRFVDEVNDPIDGLDVTFSFEGRRVKKTTDGDGTATVDGATVSFASVTVTSMASLEKILKPRFATPRVPTAVEGPHIQAQQLEKEFDPVSLEAEVLETVIITPRFACREIPAVTFEFGRSFFRRQGIQPLAEIAEDLTQDDGQLGWIFGHTDLSGPEQLNKRLSERRARAVFALLTHDFGLWDEMWNAKTKESPWFEQWGSREMQHMLNTLSVTDDDKKALEEDGGFGNKTRQALVRFQSGDYPDKPAEQASLPATGKLDTATRKELFLAYAKLVTREPVPLDKIAKVGSGQFMGCGEYNPLSLSAKDEQSRRTVVFVFDPAAQPQAPPCVIGDIKPCQANFIKPAPTKDQDPPFYKCAFYKKFADCCPKLGGADLSHDVIVRFFMPLSEADQLPHTFVLETDEDPSSADTTQPLFHIQQALKSEARAVVDGPDPAAVPTGDERLVELHFTHVPSASSYRLRVEGVSEPYDVFDEVAFHDISELSAPLGSLHFPSIFAVLNAPEDPFA